MPAAHAGAMLRHLQQLVETQARQNLTDGQLLQRFAVQREEGAFAALVRRHGRLVWRVCRHVLRREHDAEDAFQATFLVLARRANAIHKSESVASWLHGVAYRISVRAKQMAAKRSERERRAAAPEQDPAAADLAVRDLQAILDEELHRLPEKYRAPFVLCCLEGRNRAEAAAELGWKDGTISSRIAQARRLLQERLLCRGVTLSAALTAGALWDQTAAALAPPALVRGTVRMVTGIVRGTHTATAAAAATALAEGMMKTMVAGKSVLGAFLVLALGLLGTGAAVLALQAPPPIAAEDKPAPSEAKAESPRQRTDSFGDPLPEEAIARLGTLRLKHGGHIHSVAFTPDGKQLVSHGYFDGIRVWDAATGQEINHLTAEADAWISCGIVHPDGKSILTIERPGGQLANNFVRLRDRDDWKVTREISIDLFDDLRLSPNGKRILCLGVNQPQMELWDLATGQKLHSWKSHGWPYCQAFSADSKMLVTGGKDGAIRFWDLAAGRMTREILGHPNIVGIMALSGDGKLLATVGMTERRVGNGATFPWDHVIRIWDTAKGVEVRQLAMPEKESGWGELYGFSSLNFAADGKTLVSSAQDGALRFWDVATGKELRCLDLNFRGAASLAFSPGGQTLAVVAGSSCIWLIDIATGKKALPDIGHSGGVHSLVLTPDGRTAATIGGGRDIRLWDLATGKERRRLTHDDYVNTLTLSGDDRMLFSAGADKTLRAWDLGSGKELRRLSSQRLGQTWQSFAAVSADGKSVVVVPPLTGTPGAKDAGPTVCLLLDVVTGKEIRRFGDHEGWVTGAAFTPDGATLVTWDADQMVRLWNVASGEKRTEYRLLGVGFGAGLAIPGGGKVYQAYSAALSPDGRLIAECSQARFLGLQELATGKEVHRFSNLPDGVSAIAFTADSRMLAWGGWRDPTIHLVEVTTGLERHKLVGHRGRIEALAFSADGRLLVSGSEDTTAVVWDLGAPPGDKVSALTRKDPDSCWDDLVSDDAERAYRALRRLSAAPKVTIPYLRKVLAPAKPPDAKRLEALLADLDSETFETREAAMKELARVVEVVEPALRSTLAKSPSPEARRRLEQLLTKLEGRGTTGDTLRVSRALEIVERIGTPEARRLLEMVAKGPSGVWQTREAKTALERWKKRPERKD